MEQNNLFAGSIPSVKLQLVPKGNLRTSDLDQGELAVLAQKKKHVFITLASVLILFVTLNVAYFLYIPAALARLIFSIFFVNSALPAGLYYVIK